MPSSGLELNQNSFKNNWNSNNTIHNHYPASKNIIPAEEQTCNPLFTGQFPSRPTRETRRSLAVQHGRSKSWWLLVRSRLTRISRTLSRTTPKHPDLYTNLDVENVANYLPKGMAQKYRNYLCSPHLDEKFAIPVFDPFTARGEGVRKRVRIDVGDVGTFTLGGGFEVQFNILLDETTNDLCGYDVPDNFFPFVPRSNNEQDQKCLIKDDGEAIDVDKCAAILKVPFDCRDALLHGINQKPFQSSQDRPSPLFKISPQASTDNRRGYIYVPDGTATRFRFSPRAHADLRVYLDEHLPNWLEHMENLRKQQKAVPILLTSVWAARSFACAAYKSNPNTSAAQALRLHLGSGEKLEWTHAPEGCVTMLAPMADGYDEHDRLISEVPNQCFAIEGYGLLESA